MWKHFVCLAVILEVTASYKILLVFSFPGKSHGILGDGYVRRLLEDGHEVTIITPFPVKSPPPNLHQVDVSKNIELLPPQLLNITALFTKEIVMTDMAIVYEFFFNLTASTLKNKNVKHLLMDTRKKFDVVIGEWMFSELYIGFSAVFNCPFIWSSSLEPHWLVLQLIDEMPNPAYNTDYQSNNMLPLSFLERIEELYTQVYNYWCKQILYSKAENDVYQQIYGAPAALRGHTLPPLDKMKYNAALMLGNSHVSLGEATRLPQNYKPIGGYHIDTNLKPLPEDLKKIMDGAKHGVIYFSMGSNLRSKDLPDQIKKDLIKMLGALKETVIWKFEEVPEDIPKNVHILKWAPQTSILAHPNCVLFITHGGLLSTTETIHYAVPIIGIPVFADQFLNARRAVRKGYGKMVDLTYNLASELATAIRDILDDPKYAMKAKELSAIYHDRPVSPGAELTHWVRHVVRTHGAPHLRSPALMVPWYQKMYIDLFIVILFSISIVLTCIKFVLKSTHVEAKLKNKKNR